ncbi:LEA type 2 family protein [bacterium]|nr:LEA type 2 family protein [bacterium]
MKKMMWMGLALVMVVSGCAHLQSLIEPPQVRVLSVKPVFITPQNIGFRAKISVTNRVPIRIPLKKLEFTVGVNGRHFTSGAVETIEAVGGSAAQVVEVPFQINFSDLTALVVQVQKAEKMHLEFNGRLHLGGQFSFPAVPFSFKVVLPIPRLPSVTFGGFKLMHQEKNVGLKIRVKNPNTFPLAMSKIGVQATIAGQSYTLAALKDKPVIAANAEGEIWLKIGDSVGKTLSLFTQMLLNRNPQVSFSGELESETPFGKLAIPIGISSR